MMKVNKNFFFYINLINEKELYRPLFEVQKKILKKKKSFQRIS